jgi:tetratricopeptide (TPR) repeat protein
MQKTALIAAGLSILLFAPALALDASRNDAPTVEEPKIQIRSVAADMPSDQKEFVRVMLYQCSLQAGRAPEDAKALSEQLSSNQSDPYVQGQLASNRQNYPSALFNFECVPEDSLLKYDSHIWRAYCYLNMKKEDEFFEQLDKAQKLQPHSTITHFIRSCYFSRHHKPEKALKELELAKSMDQSETAVSETASGFFHQYKNEIPAAIEHYKKAIAIDPTYADAYQYLGLCYSEQRNDTMWLQYWQRAVNAEPTCPNRRYALARLLQSLDMPLQAVNQFDLALKVVPNNYKYHEQKGDCYLTTHNWNEAAQEYFSALHFEPPASQQSLKNPPKPPVRDTSKPTIPVTILRQTTRSNTSKQIVEDAIEIIPKPVLEQLQDYGVSVVISPTIAEYAIPLYKDSNGKWDPELEKCAGLYSQKKKQVIIGEDNSCIPYSRESSTEIVLHEFGHAFDHCLGKPSLSLVFKHRYVHDFARMPKDLVYRQRWARERGTRGCSQLFADMFAYLYMNEKEKHKSYKFERLFPSCYTYLKQKCPLPKEKLPNGICNNF